VRKLDSRLNICLYFQSKMSVTEGGQQIKSVVIMEPTGTRQRKTKGKKKAEVVRSLRLYAYYLGTLNVGT